MTQPSPVQPTPVQPGPQPGPGQPGPVALTPAEYYAGIEAGAAAIGALVAGGDLARPVPTCPDWTLRELAVHVGRVHRWAAQITATRAAEPPAFRTLPDGQFPAEPAGQADWLAAGAAQVVAAVGEAGQDPVWAFGAVAPASFWGRRMCHETLVHAADARLAAGLPAGLPPAPAVAADGIDEWLTVLMPPPPGQADPRAQVLPPGTALHVRASDADGPGPAEWIIRHGTAGVNVTRLAGPAGPPAGGHSGDDVVLAGPAAALLLVLLRRLPADDPSVAVTGQREVLDRWLAGMRF
jgi:uncharacterized protein (TIGR03083 family)